MNIKVRNRENPDNYRVYKDVVDVVYSLDEELDWSVLPSNTAFMYISNEEFKNYYITSACH